MQSEHTRYRSRTRANAGLVPDGEVSRDEQRTDRFRRLRFASSARAIRGFTLLETMFVVTIAAIILAVAVPNMSAFARNNRMTGAANDMLAALYLARGEAIKRHSQTIMCFSSDPMATTPTCDGSGPQGWIVFVDDMDPNAAAATDNNGQFDAGEPVLARHGGLTGITVTTLPSGNAGYVSYNSAGYRRTTALGTSINSAVLCDSRGNTALYGAAHSTARGLTLSNTGRPSVTRAVSDIASLGGCP